MKAKDAKATRETATAAGAGSGVNRVEMLEVLRLVPHALNREFPTSGEEWEEFAEDVAFRGVQVPLVVRALPRGSELVEGNDWEVLAGHRRQHAAKVKGVSHVPCEIRVMNDLEALEYMFLDNFRRREMDAVDEARFVQALIAQGRKPEALAARMKVSLEYVRTRQLIMDLPLEAQAALRLPKDADGHLHIGTVQLLLPLDAREREVAVQMILHPEFDLRTLNVRQAADAIEEVIVKPRRAREAWDGQREKLGKEWRKRLKQLARKGTEDEVLVLVPPWCDDATGGQVSANGGRAGRDRDAEESVPLAECLPDAPGGLRWLHLAVRHGLAVRVVPEGEDGTRSKAVVDELVLRQAEAARGGEAWLVTGKRKAVVIGDQSSVISEQPSTGEPHAARADHSVDGRVADALSVMDGEGERSYDGEERAEVVIEQVMEQTGVIDLGAVRRLREWAISRGTPEQFDYYVPGWAAALVAVSPEAGTDLVVKICDWVLSLKWKPKAVVPGDQ